MKYHIITFGCQMNKSDSERIAAVLELAGLSPATDINHANLLIINSCSVRQSAINRIFGLLNNLKKKRKLRFCHHESSASKRSVEGFRPLSNDAVIPRDSSSAYWQTQNDNLKTILTGCVLESEKKKLADKFDLIIDIKELTQKPEKLIEFLRLENQEFKAFDYTDYFKINPQYRSKFSAYIPIMTGCNNFCAYCAVPYTRGREVSRPAKEIIKEIKTLIEKGYKEITLLGQNVNSYRSEMNKQKIDFTKLLKIINGIPGDFWIRFLTSHPKDMNDKLIKTMARCKKVAEYVHLPVQSGDNVILNKMNRHYTQEQYLKLINKIKKTYQSCHCEKRSDEAISKPKNRIKDCFANAGNDKFLPLAISTDVIVGFPGEAKKQFQNTAKLMRRVKFDMAYISEYSPRPGTAAAKFKDTVSIAEKKRRKEFLNEVLRKTALANNKKYIGKTVEVLIEKTDTGFFYGKTRTFKNVKVPISANTHTAASSIITRSLSVGGRRSHTSGRSAGGGQSRINRDNVQDCRAFLLPDEKLAMTILKPGQFARIKITQANAWGLEGYSLI